jgi:hypothetical protein
MLKEARPLRRGAGRPNGADTTESQGRPRSSLLGEKALDGSVPHDACASRHKQGNSTTVAGPERAQSSVPARGVRAAAA